MHHNTYACGRPATVTDSKTVIEWFAAFGLANMWVSDQGNHFKNHVVKVCSMRLALITIL
jgi:hypothetical protein